MIPPDLSAPYGLNRFSLKAGDHLTNITLRNDFSYSGVSISDSFISCIYYLNDCVIVNEVCAVVDE